jgi:hypothetical protein
VLREKNVLGGTNINTLGSIWNHNHVPGTSKILRLTV